MLDAIANAVGGAADAIVGAAEDTYLSAQCVMASREIKKLLEGMNIKENNDIKIECAYDYLKSDSERDEWRDWLGKTGLNSICCEDTWDFLEDSNYNRRKRDNFLKRGLKKIILAVEDEIQEDMRDWTTCDIEYEESNGTLTIWWYPRALRWKSSGGWLDGGSRCWWIIRDEIVFAMQIYQLPGKCFYKSDWLDNFDDVDPDSKMPFGGNKKFKRWFQFRHWVLMWYPEAQWGWNYQWTTKPPKNPDGSDFSMDSVLSLPSLPSFSMPSLKLPSLPDVSMPSLSMPSMPSLSMPSISAPSLSAPSLSMPSIPKQPKRPANRWACHGIVEMTGMKVKAKGKTLVLSDITVINLWEEDNGHIRDEKKEHQRFDLECTDEEQAQSWFESLCGGGAEEGEVGGGCCTVA